jgi:hypothetical protein
MGDIWPYGPPAYISYDQAVSDMEFLGMSASDADIMAAIGTAESSLDYRVINDTPSTGDYSVGIWQINYLGSLYASRTAAYGTPKSLIDRGHAAQAYAAHDLWRQSGFSPWSTYNDGAYKYYLHGAHGGSHSHGQTYVPIPAPTDPGNDSWEHQIRAASGHLAGMAHTFDNAARAIELIRR